MIHHYKTHLHLFAKLKAASCNKSCKFALKVQVTQTMQDAKIATTLSYISLNIDLAKWHNQRKTSSPIVALVCNLLYNNVTNFKHWFAVVCGTAFEIEIYGKELPAMAIKRVFQKEPVLSITACLALVSSCFVLPDAEYLGYIDFRTLAILFSLMTVMAGLRGQGVFDRLGRALLSHTRTTLQLTAVLVGLCFFFSSMVITNDVSLLTFVPFTFVVVNSLDAAVRDKLLLPIVCMQTIAANLGSMLTPLGNPQNLYLYGKSGMDMGSFVLLMLPLLHPVAGTSCAMGGGAVPPWRKDLHGSFCGCCKPEQGTIIAVQYFIRALPVGGTACSALWYRVCCSSGLCAFGRPEHIMPCGLFADPHLCCALYLYWQSGAFCRLFRMAAAYSYRP